MMLWTSRERAGRARYAVGRAVLGAWLATGALVLGASWSSAAGPSGPGAGPASAQDDDLEALLAGERAAADALRRRGEWEAAGAALDTLVREALEEGEDDWRSRAERARLRWDEGRFDEALEDAEAAAAARPVGPVAPELARAHAVALGVRAELGRTDDLDGRLAAAARAGYGPGVSARVDLEAGRLLLEAGRRDEGLARWRAAARWRGEAFEELLAAGRAARGLGDLVGASNLLVAAARAGERDPQVLAELASLYLEADGEVDAPDAAARNPGPLLREARRVNPRSEPALLTLAELYRLNWRRSHFEADELVSELLAARPNSVAGRLFASESALLLGDLAGARAELARAEAVAPGRRAVRILRASLTAVAGSPADAEPLVSALVAEDPADSAPERTVGVHLVDLYRFREGLGPLERATERDPGDHRAFTALGRARANTGDVAGAREALARADEAAAGRRDAVRANLARVLRIVDEEFVEHTDGELTFAWRERGSELLALYLVPFYREARRELSARYGYSTGPVRIEVFDRHADFSVRSTGFEGFPALGVCFGPVVTAVSPVAEPLRGRFSWARTGYHEFTHVVHLGLSHNKCPRWVTEGLATWEEERVNPAWTRNMREDLAEARANGTIFPVRELNAAFRGPRVVFGYYQGGLLCDMLVERYGFGSMLQLLERFDAGDDLDTALAAVFGRTPEELDAEFARYVDAYLEGVRIEPRWDADRLRPRWLTLERRAPADPLARVQWAQRWLDLGFAAWQEDRRPDAEEALRVIGALGDPLPEGVPPRALFLRAQLALSDGGTARGRELLEAFVEAGGEDFRARLALAELARAAGERADAEHHLLMAEAAFPGHPDPDLAAELALARLLDGAGRPDDAMAARGRWLRYNADDWQVREELARWHAAAGRHEDAVRLFDEANQVEPFHRGLHLAWAESLVALGRDEEVLREVRAFELVEPELDAVAEGPPTDQELARVEVARARGLLGLGRTEEARAAARRARELAPTHPRVRALLEEVPE